MNNLNHVLDSFDYLFPKNESCSEQFCNKTDGLKLCSKKLNIVVMNVTK